MQIDLFKNETPTIGNTLLAVRSFENYTNFKVESGEFSTGITTHYRCVCKLCAVELKDKYDVSGNYFSSKYGSRTDDGMRKRYVDDEEIKKWNNPAKFNPIDDEDGKGFYVLEYDFNLVKFGGLLECEICKMSISHNPFLE